MPRVTLPQRPSRAALAPCCLLLCLAGLAPAWAEPEGPDAQAEAEPAGSAPTSSEPATAAPDLGGKLQGNLRELESWLIFEEEIVPEPPLVRLDIGFVAFIEARSRIRSDKGGLRGSDLEDLEGEQGLETSGLGPYINFNVGGKVRGGGEVFQFVRNGQFMAQEKELVFSGARLAIPGDLVRSRFEFLALSSYVEWDILYGQKYRIGLIGGLRYFRLDLDLTGLSVRGARRGTSFTSRVQGELLSPSFGGLIELSPFPYLTVSTQVHFMSWSWRAVELSSARYFELRLGARLNVIPETFSIGLEYRFLVVDVLPQAGSGRVQGALTASGLGVNLGFSF